jgi:hypothetical protein
VGLSKRSVKLTAHPGNGQRIRKRNELEEYNEREPFVEPECLDQSMNSWGKARRSVATPSGAQVIDGGGRVLMPGLTDAHWYMTRAPNACDAMTDASLMYANTVVASTCYFCPRPSS